MLTSIQPVVEALGSPPPIEPVQVRPRPPGGTLNRALGAAKGSQLATRIGGHLVFIQYRVAPDPDAAIDPPPPEA